MKIIIFYHSVAVSRCKDVPPFGPPIPETPFKKGPEFTDFLFAKGIHHKFVSNIVLNIQIFLLCFPLIISYHK